MARPNGDGRDLEEAASTSDLAILSLPPSSPEREAMSQWIASVEKRLGGGAPPPAPPPDPPAVPEHLRKTKQLLDFAKYVLILILGLIGIGWLGREYVSQFQTAASARQSQSEISRTIQTVSDGVEDNDRSIRNLRVRGVRIELEQQTTQDRLEQVLELQQADTRIDRSRAQVTVRQIQRRIDRRNRVIQDPVALRRVSDRIERDPLAGLGGI